MKKVLLVATLCASMTAQADIGRYDDPVENTGDILMFAMGAIALGTTLTYEDGWANKAAGSTQLIAGSLVAQGITQGLKTVVDKPRPNGNCCESFPSGHTSGSFSTAGFMHKRYGWKVAMPFYLGSAYVGYSRVHADKHYVEDVLVGAAIGTISGYFFATEYQGVTITPTASTEFVGINFATVF